MAKRVNPMAVKANATYDVFEAARALNVTPHAYQRLPRCLHLCAPPQDAQRPHTLRIHL